VGERERDAPSSELCEVDAAIEPPAVPDLRRVYGAREQDPFGVLAVEDCDLESHPSGALAPGLLANAEAELQHGALRQGDRSTKRLDVSIGQWEADHLNAEGLTAADVAQVSQARAREFLPAFDTDGGGENRGLSAAASTGPFPDAAGQDDAVPAREVVGQAQEFGKVGGGVEFAVEQDPAAGAGAQTSLRAESRRGARCEQPL
jgi:hypothetical protein